MIKTLCLILALTAVAFCSTSNATEPRLQYKLTAYPGDLRLDRKPGGGLGLPYKEHLTFSVTNPTRSDYLGRSPDPCKAFKMQIFRVDGSEAKLMTTLPIGLYCEKPPRPPGTVLIHAGDTWRRAQDWIFRASDVTDGNYVAVGSFLPTGSIALTFFRISSTK